MSIKNKENKTKLEEDVNLISSNLTLDQFA